MQQKGKLKDKLKYFIMLLAGLVVGLLNGLFGSGGGMICVPILKRFGLEQKKAQATAMFVILPISIASMIIYITRGGFNFGANIFIITGVILGGIVGAKLLNKMNNNVVGIIFAVLMLAAGIRMVCV
ncbi:MAG: sulfite exporter TauE/SafE family protein [Christensenellaceae bacterium]|jgi:uncharacterized membrane protein YfcA|nr:sulfite exporter TauE/SafE family protein [Christensenellaceae bacterium]